MSDKPSPLTEWDFDIPKDNRFHDPFRWQDQQTACSEAPAASRVNRPSGNPPPDDK